MPPFAALAAHLQGDGAGGGSLLGHGPPSFTMFLPAVLMEFAVRMYSNQFSEPASGTILDRETLARSYRSGDRTDWVGTWTIDRSDLCGLLTINGFMDLHVHGRVTHALATFESADGTHRPVQGRLDPNDGSRLTLTIGFPGTDQTLELYCFRSGPDDASPTIWCAKTPEERIPL